MGSEWAKPSHTTSYTRGMTAAKRNILTNYSKMKRSEEQVLGICKLSAHFWVNLPEEWVGNLLRFTINLLLDKNPSKLMEHNLIFEEVPDSIEYEWYRVFKFEYKLVKRMHILMKVQGREKSFEGIFNVNDLLMLKGKYGNAEKVQEEQEVGGSIVPINFDEEILGQIGIKEEKPVSSKRIQFKWSGELNTDHPVVLVFYEVIGSNLKLIYQTSPTERDIDRLHTPLHYFETISLNADVFENDILTTKKIELNLIELKKDKKGFYNRKIYGKRRFRLKNVLELLEGTAFSIELLDANSKENGRLNFFNPLIRPIFTFLDYRIHRELKIVPIVVIDFSISNLTFQEDNEWVHTLKKGELNQYIVILENIAKAFTNLADKVVVYGLGCQANKKDRCATDIYPFNEEAPDQPIKMEELVDMYKHVVGKIGISSPANFSPVMEKIRALAKIESQQYECRRYYNLIYVTPGVVDDYDPTIEWLKDVQHLPMSVTILKISNEQLKGADDFMLMEMDIERGIDLRKKQSTQMIKASYIEVMSKSKPSKLERNFMGIFHYEDYKNKPVKLREEIAKLIPIQSQMYMENNNVFAYDLKENDYATQKSIEFKLRETLKFKSKQLQIAISKRDSLVGLKEYINTLESQRIPEIEELAEEEVKNENLWNSGGQKADYEDTQNQFEGVE